MAQRKKTTTVTEILPEETQQSTNESGIGIADFTVVLTKVHRLVNGKRAFAFQTEDDVDEVLIQDRYPQGGSFGVERFNDIGQSVERVVMDIDPKPMAGNPPINGTPAHGNDAVMSMLMNELSWMRQTMTNMILKNNDGGDKSTIGELVGALQGLNGLVGGKDPMDLFLKGMDMASKFAKNGGTDTDWKTQLIDVVKENAGPVIQAFNMLGQQRNGNGEQPPMRIVQTPESQMKEGIDWLKKKILAGLTPDLAVEWITTNANDPQYQPIIATAINGGVDAFIALDAEIGNEPYKTWFTTAIEDLKGIYAEQSSNVADIDGRNGNGADVTGDAKHSPAKPKKSKTV